MPRVFWPLWICIAALLMVLLSGCIERSAAARTLWEIPANAQDSAGDGQASVIVEVVGVNGTAPLAGVPVLVYPRVSLRELVVDSYPPDQLRSSIWGRTNAAGKFRVELSDGIYTFVAGTEGYTTEVRYFINVKEGQEQTLRLTLFPREVAFACEGLLAPMVTPGYRTGSIYWLGGAIPVAPEAQTAAGFSARLRGVEASMRAEPRSPGTWLGLRFGIQGESAAGWQTSTATGASMQPYESKLSLPEANVPRDLRGGKVIQIGPTVFIGSHPLPIEFRIEGRLLFDANPSTPETASKIARNPPLVLELDKSRVDCKPV